MIRKNVIKYISCMALNSFSTSCSFVISTHSMLNSITSSNASSQTLITSTFISKDIIGQLGCLLYSLKTGKKADINPKKYSLKGSIFLESSIYLETLSPFLKDTHYVAPYLGISSVLKNIAYISIGSVNTVNFQRINKDNIGELYTKVASINTLSSTLGMIVGLGIIKTCSLYSFCFLPILSSVSIYSMQKSISIAFEEQNNKTNQQEQEK